ncbi:MAG: acetyl-CoA carboxylase biotin carboxyl carrier protein [Phycisphaerales bacterium]
MVDLKTLKQLIKLMVDNDLTELDIEAEGGPVKIKRNSQGTVTHVVPSGIAAPAPMPAAPAPAAPAAASPAAAPADSGVTIDSPMVGTFYSASSPDAKAFANVGDRVDEDTVVCIIEAMKVFNEIKAEVSGTIEKVLIENGQAVEFGQPLFTIKPD